VDGATEMVEAGLFTMQAPGNPRSRVVGYPIDCGQGGNATAGPGRTGHHQAGGLLPVTREGTVASG
jgi:hypothetical protein